MRKIFVIMLFIVSCHYSNAQIAAGENKLWSSLSKLAAEDFQIITEDESNPIKSQFNLAWQIQGFSVFDNNFNDNVTNHFVRSASIINPNVSNIRQLLFYQQLNFDLAEVYARRMRRDLLVNKSKLWKGFNYATQILNESVNEFYGTQLLMDRNTAGGTDVGKVQIWKDKIDRELKDTQQFEYDYKGKIEIDKSSESSLQKDWL